MIAIIILDPGVQRLISIDPRLNFSWGFFIPLYKSFFHDNFFLEHPIIKFLTKRIFRIFFKELAFKSGIISHIYLGLS